MKNSEQPAFPVSEETTDRVDAGIKIYSGLTKREYFAAMAMQGLLAHSYSQPKGFEHAELPPVKWDDNMLVRTAIDYADALITELEKPTTE